MNFKKILITATACALLLSGCAAGESGKTAIEVGNTVITDNALKFTAQELMGAADISAAADALEQSYLVAAIAEKMGIELTEDEERSIKQEIATFKSNHGGKKAGDKFLKSHGVDDNLLRAIVASSMYSDKIFQEIILTEPTDDDLRNYFKEDFLRAKHVLVMTTDRITGEDLDAEAMAEAEKKANEVLEKAKNGENFDALIEEYNEDPGMASNEEGYFFTDKQMVSEFENATKSIQPGEFTMCKSSYGYHIIQRLPIEGDSFDKYFEDNKTAVSSAYSSVQQQKALEAKAEELGIETKTNQDVIDAISLDEPTPEPTEESTDKTAE